MKKVHFLEILFFVILASSFIIPIIADTPHFINAEGCDCDDCEDQVCEFIDYILFGDVEEMDVFVKIPPIMQQEICNVKSKFYIKDNSGNIIIDEFIKLGPNPTEKSHSYENQLYVRTVKFDKPIGSNELKAIDFNDPSKVKMTFYACLLNSCEPPLERQVVPMNYEMEGFEASNGTAKLIIVFKGPWNWLGCIECCD